MPRSTRDAPPTAMSLGGDAARRALDAAAGLLSFDELAYTPPRLHVLWLENSLDCRTWCALRPPPPPPPPCACALLLTCGTARDRRSYYCDIREAMGRIHKLCTPRGGLTCVEPNRDFKAQVRAAGRRRRVATAPRTRAHARHLPPRAALTVGCVSAARRGRSALHGERCLRRRDRRV